MHPVRFVLMTAVSCLIIGPQAQAQTEPAVVLQITAVDHYTRDPLENAGVSVSYRGTRVDSAATDMLGQVVFTVQPTTAIQEPPTPASFGVSQNYPNPFTGITSIDLDIPEEQSVHLALYSPMGQQIAMQQRLLPEGYHTLTLNMDHLSTGIYFLRVSGHESHTVKLLNHGMGSRQPDDVMTLHPGLPGNGTPPDREAAGAYVITAARERYESTVITTPVTQDLALEVPLKRLNEAVFIVEDEDALPLQYALGVTGEGAAYSITTPDTLVLYSGLYSVRGIDAGSSIDTRLEIASRDTTVRLTAYSNGAGFRVKPYLQNPTQEGMRFTWFTASNQPGELSIRGPGIQGQTVYVSEPVYQPALEYTDRERNQSITGLVPGSWLLAERNYKHTIEVDGLQAGREYEYTVRQSGAVFQERFATAPSRQQWDHVRFVALADSETEPLGRVRRREWPPGALAENSLPRPEASVDGMWDRQFGTILHKQVRTLRYMLTESKGYIHNLRIIENRDPHFVVMPGDLVQGGGYQPAWDEFWRQNAGELNTVLSRRPLIPALGNWEMFAALNDGYGTPQDRTPVVRSRAKYKTYFDSPPNDTEAHQDNYHRIDYGPVTVLTLDSTNGEPDDRRANYNLADRATGREYRGPGTDTQENVTRAEYEAAGGTDLSDFNPGSIQWNWVEEQLADARRQGQIVFVQFHHAPFSSGEHGLPMYHELSSGQGGTPMRQYHPLFKEYDVVAVLCGHSEMFERSFVDKSGGGRGVHYYDVGVAGDGLRGEMVDGRRLDDPLLKYNPYSQWTADQHEPERWIDVDGTIQLVEGGKHYGHLEVNVERLPAGTPEEGYEDAYARVTMTPVYSFPVFDAQYELVRTERRVYNDEVILYVDSQGRVIYAP